MRGVRTRPGMTCGRQDLVSEMGAFIQSGSVMDHTYRVQHMAQGRRVRSTAVQHFHVFSSGKPLSEPHPAGAVMDLKRRCAQSAGHCIIFRERPCNIRSVPVAVAAMAVRRPACPCRDRDPVRWHSMDVPWSAMMGQRPGKQFNASQKEYKAVPTFKGRIRPVPMPLALPPTGRRQCALHPAGV